jgi:hypothetical protein
MELIEPSDMHLFDREFDKVRADATEQRLRDALVPIKSFRTRMVKHGKPPK